MKTKLIVTITVLLLVTSGLLGYRIYIDKKVESSKVETETLSKKEISPIDLSLESNSISNDQISENNSIENNIISKSSQSSQSNFSSSSPTNLQNYSGTWTGVGNYKVNGSAQILDTNNKTVLQLSSDFRFGGAPDPVIYLSSEKKPNGIDNAILIGPLNNFEGASAWEIDNNDLKKYNGSIVLWCKAFKVNMGFVELN